MNLHSSRSVIDFKQFADFASKLGAQSATLQQIEQANTSEEVLQICSAQEIPIAQYIGEQAHQFLRRKLPDTVDLDIIIVDRTGAIL